MAAQKSSTWQGGEALAAGKGADGKAAEECKSCWLEESLTARKEAAGCKAIVQSPGTASALHVATAWLRNLCCPSCIGLYLCSIRELEDVCPWEG